MPQSLWKGTDVWEGEAVEHIQGKRGEMPYTWHHSDSSAKALREENKGKNTDL